MERARVAEIACVVGLEDIAEELAALAMPSLRLIEVEDGDETPSQLGGRPRLPEGTPWPEVASGRPDAGAPMCFIAQIDLGSVPDWLTPARGLLTLWTETAHLHMPGAVRAILVSPEGALREREWPTALAEESRRLVGQMVRFEPELTLPGLGVNPALALEPLGFGWRTPDWARQDAYHLLRERMESEQFPHPPARREQGRPFYHRLGGYADHRQTDPLMDCVVNRLEREGRSAEYDERTIEQAKAWRLLLEEHHEWGDGGALYFCIPGEDLTDSRFDRVELTVQGG